MCTDTSEIHLRPHSPGLPPFNQQHPNTLDCLAWLYFRCCRDRVHHRQRNPRLRRPGLTYRRPARSTHVFSAVWNHVAV